jgi:hypothetical protein
VRNWETFKNWDSVSYSISWITYHTCSSSIWIKRKYGLNGNI